MALARIKKLLLTMSYKDLIFQNKCHGISVKVNGTNLIQSVLYMLKPLHFDTEVVYVTVKITSAVRPMKHLFPVMKTLKWTCYILLVTNLALIF